MAATYRGVIRYAGSDAGTSVAVRKYEWAENALILHFGSITEIIPFHAFAKASFEAMPERYGGGPGGVSAAARFCSRPCRNGAGSDAYRGGGAGGACVGGFA